MDTLTAAQEQLLLATISNWTALINSTMPIDRESVSVAIADLYSSVGLQSPLLIYCASPLQMALMPGAVAEIRKLGPNAPVEGLTSMRARIKNQLQVHWGGTFGAHLEEQLWSRIEQQLIANARVHELSPDHFRPTAIAGDMAPQELPWWETLMTAKKRLEPELRRRIQDRFQRLTFNESIVLGLSARLRFTKEDVFPDQPNAHGHLHAWDLVWYFANYVGLADFYNTLLNLTADSRFLNFASVIKSVHGLDALEAICFICERPTVLTVDERGLLHNDSQAAVQYADGFKLYAWHGTRVNWTQSDLIESPALLTVQQIEAEKNVETRRIMLERFGQARFIKESGPQVIDSDIDPQNGDERSLYYKEVDDDEPLVMVSVKNSTREADGSQREYLLRVPPSIRTAKEAVAWTFEMSPQDYKPTEQT